jgi:hypothetical protein
VVSGSRATVSASQKPTPLTPAVTSGEKCQIAIDSPDYGAQCPNMIAEHIFEGCLRSLPVRGLLICSKWLGHPFLLPLIYPVWLQGAVSKSGSDFDMSGDWKTVKPRVSLVCADPLSSVGVDDERPLSCVVFSSRTTDVVGSKIIS